MKVFSAPAPASALDLWLRETGTEADAASAASRASLAEPFSVPPVSDATQARDMAEGLLDLDVWNGAAQPSRSLTTTAGPPYGLAGQVPLAAAQGWAEHIFETLSMKSA
jgi:hypothetical protein